MPATHTVENQPPPLVDYNLYATDPLLPALVEQFAPRVDHAGLIEHGRLMGSAEVIELGFLANRNPPLLHTHDRYGHRIEISSSTGLGTGCSTSPFPEVSIRCHGKAGRDRPLTGS